MLQASDTAGILFVEDSLDDVELMMRAFSIHDYADQVMVVSDGAEALA